MNPLHTLLIHAPKMADRFSPLGASISINYMAVGLPALAGALERSGRRTEILHLGVQHFAEPGFDLVSEARRLQPALVGLSLHWHPQSWDTVAAIRAVRQGAPGAFIVIGGFTATAMHREILETVPELDGVIRGDGEQGLVELAQAIDAGDDLGRVSNLSWRGTTGVVENPLSYSASETELRDLDYERFDLMRHFERYQRDFCGPAFVPHHRPQAMMMSLAQKVFGGGGRYMVLPAGRGCSVSCGWCGGGRGAYRKLHGRSKVAMLSPGRTAALIARASELGFEGVHACFDPTPKDPRHWLEVFDKVASSGVRTEMFWESFALPHPDLVAALRATFTRVLISMSPESPDEPVRRRFRPLHFSNDALVDAVAMCATHNVEIMLCFGRGLPGESPDSPRRARALVDRCRAAAKGAKLSCRSFAVEMEPGSPWAEKPSAYGIELVRRSFGDYLEAHTPGASGPMVGLGYRVPDYFGEDTEHYQEDLRKAACKEMCPLPPSPALGHLTCRILQRLAPNS